MKLSPSDYAVTDDGCWTWQRACNEQGYGMKQVGTLARPRMARAHRVYWEVTNGPVPHGLELDHVCRNRACVNPAHLEPVSHAENMRRGARAKLTAEQVREIRRSSATPLALAEGYGVSRTTIYQVLNNYSWKGI